MTDLTKPVGIDALPGRAGNWLYTRRFLEALVAAATMHAAQRRKGTNIPYASHLLGACSIALDYGATEDEAIAALLHDAIEDVGSTDDVRAVVASFGPEVLRIVEGCTKVPGDSLSSKKAYVAHLETADASILLVSGADKLHNARSIVADLRRHGPAMLTRFNVAPADTLAYYRDLVCALRANPAHNSDLVDEVDRVVTDMERLAAAGQPEAPGKAQATPELPAGPATTWEDFEGRLALVLERMASNSFLVLTAPGPDERAYYVQFAQGGRAGFRAEAVSNAFLQGRWALSPGQEDALADLGWQCPAPHNTDLNFMRQWPLPAPFAEVASLAVRSLRDVYGLREPSELVYRRFARGGRDFTEPTLGIAPAMPIAPAESGTPPIPIPLDGTGERPN
jgi:hypothetical protein